MYIKFDTVLNTVRKNTNNSNACGIFFTIKSDKCLLLVVYIYDIHIQYKFYIYS